MSDEMRDDAHEPATKGDMNVMRGGLRDDIVTAVRDMIRPLALATAHHSAELADIRGYMKDKLVTRDEFHSRMDGFTRRVEDFDWSAAKNLDRLDDHEKRIRAIEKKNA